MITSAVPLLNLSVNEFWDKVTPKQCCNFQSTLFSFWYLLVSENSAIFPVSLVVLSHCSEKMRVVPGDFSFENIKKCQGPNQGSMVNI
jgi:hypothetical protein